MTAFNVRPSSARQRNAILMAFRWSADDGSLLVAFGLSYLKKIVEVGPPLTKLSESAHAKTVQINVRWNTQPQNLWFVIYPRMYGVLYMQLYIWGACTKLRKEKLSKPR